MLAPKQCCAKERVRWAGTRSTWLLKLSRLFVGVRASPTTYNLPQLTALFMFDFIHSESRA